MTDYKCPYCRRTVAFTDATLAVHNINFEYKNIGIDSKMPYLEIAIIKCPYDDCNNETILATGMNGYIHNSHIAVYPPAAFRRFPDYVPLAIRRDYEEASIIVRRSPKAAATLARRCLQGMIHDFWNIHAQNLNAEITQLKGKIPASQWKAIDAVRKIGNIGAHMERDVNLIIEIDADAAEKLVQLIEHLIEKWYIERHEEDELYAELTAISQETDNLRTNQDTDH